MQLTSRGRHGLRLRACALLVAASGAALGADDPLPGAGAGTGSARAERAPGVPDDATLEAAGAVIGDIRYARRSVFDTRLAEEDKALFRLANRIHVLTRESTLESQLLFAPGDPYSAQLIENSERILRAQPYLGEVRIRPVAVRGNVVDIEVATQDTWTLRPELFVSSKGGSGTGGAGIRETNLFGLGSELGISYRKGLDRDSTTLSYRDPQLFGSRWLLDTRYAANSDGHGRLFALEHPFYALDARWSAGARWLAETRIDPIYQNGQVATRFGSRVRTGTIYRGWSDGLRDGSATRWTFGVTHDEREVRRVDPGPLPRERRLVYPWIGVQWIEDAYRETTNLDQIARTEDLALGWNASIKLGRATESFGSDRAATVFEANATKGHADGDAHTLLLGATTNGRFEGGAAADTLLGLSARYWWRRSPHRVFYASLGVDRGFNLDIDRQLNLGAENGLRGYPVRYRSGQGRWLFTLEERTYTDWYLFRLFNVAWAAFYDMGATTGGNVVPGAPQPLPGQDGILKNLGVGLRLGNNRLSFGSVVHIDVAFPLDGDASIGRFQINVEGKRSF